MSRIDPSSQAGAEQLPRSGVRGFRADKLRELRERAGLTPDDLAARLGATRQAVSTWETGRSIPTPEMLGKIASTLDAAVVALVPIAPHRRDLRDLRVHAALNQVQAAAALNVSPTTVGETEKGRKVVDHEMARKFAELYNVTVVSLIEAWERTNQARATRSNSL